MQFKDALHLSTKTFQAHPKRNLLIIAVTGIIFALILTINLWLQGLINSYSRFASRPSAGQVIVQADNAHSHAISAEVVPTLASREEMISDLEAHGAHVLGDAQYFDNLHSLILPADLFKGIPMIDPANAPIDAAPILVEPILGSQFLGHATPIQHLSITDGRQAYESYRESLLGKTFTTPSGAKYYVVGLAPGTFSIRNLSFQQLERSNVNLLNPFLEQIPTPDCGSSIIIDNGHSSSWQAGSKDLLDLTPDNGSRPTSSNAPLTSPTFKTPDTIIAVFENSRTAYDYFRHGHGRGQFLAIDLPDRTYSVSVLAGLSPEIQLFSHIAQLITGIASIILGLVAIVIIIFTSIRLVDQDAPNLALYSSLGATARQIRTIYLCYFLILMLGAALFAFTLASIVVLSFSFVNQDLLSTQALLGFSLVSAPHVIWYGVNLSTFLIIAIMLLLAPLCVFLNRRRLTRASSRH